MSEATKLPANVTNISAQILEKTLLHGDLSSLLPAQRVEYMQAVCKTLGLNPLTKPFEFISLKGKLVMYAKRDATEQLRKIHSVSIKISARELVDGIYVVTAQATDGNGRVDESIGAVPVDHLKGEEKSNAMMKSETKAKRRVTLSICGLGLLDETEVESVVSPSQPLEESDSVGDYVVSFGKFKDRTLHEVPFEDLLDYVKYIKESALKENKTIGGRVKELIDAVNAYGQELNG